MPQPPEVRRIVDGVELRPKACREDRTVSVKLSRGVATDARSHCARSRSRVATAAGSHRAGGRSHAVNERKGGADGSPCRRRGT